MSGLKISFNAPLNELDTEQQTYGCRVNNPDICANNGLVNVCAFASRDGICSKPSRAWKKQFAKLREVQNNE
jgi:hypothetical protein